MRWVQSTWLGCHANRSRSPFQNPWIFTGSTSSTSTYWPAFLVALNLYIFRVLFIRSLPLEHIRNSEYHAHFPIEVDKLEWGNSAASRERFSRRRG